MSWGDTKRNSQICKSYPLVVEKYIPILLNVQECGCHFQWGKMESNSG